MNQHKQNDNPDNITPPPPPPHNTHTPMIKKAKATGSDTSVPVRISNLFPIDLNACLFPNKDSISLWHIDGVVFKVLSPR